MAKSTVVPFDLPSEFSPDPLTEVTQAGARDCCARRFKPRFLSSLPSMHMCWTRKAAGVWLATDFCPSVR
ncbi:hypothetical protein C8N32_12310 [Rhodovulum imhoffii]|uniref:Uncharacterized protein n=1 Tax=Rhodovulum imhoffii TaxID=365340 RepID=A0A2T5BP20_9RHOB|nr:hypothetical protein [Rhodovulum imhoffii]PTN00747.1 hypothetical protein C8N32_12310 [Rhodovulum imhoffii]